MDIDQIRRFEYNLEWICMSQITHVYHTIHEVVLIVSKTRPTLTLYANFLSRIDRTHLYLSINM